MANEIIHIPNYRIGNDLPISFFVEINKGGMLLSDANTTILFFDPYGIAVDMTWNISGNQVSGTFLGKDQKRTGLYTMKVILNKGDYGMATSDRQMFRLVPHTWEGDTEPGGWEDFTVTMTDVLSVEEMEDLRELLNSGMPEIEGRVGDLEDRATALEGRATDLEDRATALEDRATAVEDRVTDIENNVVTAEETAEALAEVFE